MQQFLMYICVELHKYNKVEIATLTKKGRINVAHNGREILRSIAKNEPEGRHTTQIKSDTGLHRATVSRLCGVLEKDDWISRRNKQSEYHLGKKAYGYPELYLYLFYKETVGKILSWQDWICESNKFCNNEFCKQISLHPKFCDNKLHRAILNGVMDFDSLKNADKKAVREHFDSFKGQWNGLVLFEFANRIGAIIVYTMIEALRKKKFNKINEIMEIDIPLKGKKKEEMTLKWMDYAATNLQYLLDNFAKFWNFGRENIKSSHRNEPGSLYEINEEDFGRLSGSYKSVYPRIYDEFENIKKRIPEDIEQYKTRFRELKMEKEDPNHLKCNGRLVPVFN